MGSLATAAGVAARGNIGASLPHCKGRSEDSFRNKKTVEDRETNSPSSTVFFCLIGSLSPSVLSAVCQCLVLEAAAVLFGAQESSAKEADNKKIANFTWVKFAMWWALTDLNR
ncbi:MAG: hypothetical protein ACOYJZ_01410 [Acutalibacter sp.]|jgi:hypothetical protein